MAEQDISAQLQRIEDKTKALEKAQASAKNSGRIVVVLILVVAIGMIAFAIQPFISLARNPAPLTAELQTAVTRVLAPQAQEEARLLWQEVLPVYEEAVPRILDESYPEVSGRLGAEFDTFKANLERETRRRVGALAQQVFEENQHLILEWLPELASDDDPSVVDEAKAEAYAGRLGRIVEDAGARAAQELFGPHFAALSRLEIAFQSLEPPQQIAAMSDPDLRTFIGDRISELLSAALAPAPVDEADAP